MRTLYSKSHSILDTGVVHIVFVEVLRACWRWFCTRSFIPYSNDCPYYLRLHKFGSVFMGAFRGELCSVFRHDSLP